jgi:hypothetical protein
MTWEPFFSGVTLGALSLLCGAGFAVGMVVVCRWTKWAPVNIVVNDYRRERDGG